MIRTFLMIAMVNSQTGEVVKLVDPVPGFNTLGEVVKLVDPVPGFNTLQECQEALKLVPVSRGLYRYKAWCLTPSDIDI